MPMPGPGLNFFPDVPSEIDRNLAQKQAACKLFPKPQICHLIPSEDNASFCLRCNFYIMITRTDFKMRCGDEEQ